MSGSSSPDVTSGLGLVCGGGALSVGRRLPLELLAEYVSLTKACCCLCKLTTRQSRCAKEACGSCVVYNLPLGAATPGNLVLRSAAIFTLFLVKTAFTPARRQALIDTAASRHQTPMIFWMRNSQQPALEVQTMVEKARQNTWSAVCRHCQWRQASKTW